MYVYNMCVGVCVAYMNYYTKSKCYVAIMQLSHFSNVAYFNHIHIAWKQYGIWHVLCNQIFSLVFGGQK